MSPVPTSGDAIRRWHAEPVYCGRSARSAAAPSRNTWLQLVARPVGVAVDEHPDAPRHAVRHVLLLRAEQRDVVEAERGAGRAGRELGVQIGVVVKKMLTMSSCVELVAGEAAPSPGATSWPRSRPWSPRRT